MEQIVVTSPKAFVGEIPGVVRLIVRVEREGYICAEMADLNREEALKLAEDLTRAAGKLNAV